MKLFFPVLFAVILSNGIASAADHAVILLYHHISNETPPSTSVSPEIFRRHLEYLDSGKFNVLPLSKIVHIVSQGGSLPDRTVAITFDDAYRSLLDQAIAMLAEKKYPFTVFVNTEAVDREYSSSLTWRELKQLLDAGGEIGSHSHTHDHLVRQLPGETKQDWLVRVAGDIQTAHRRIREELGIKVEMFAYPFGEHTSELRQLINSLGYYGITQQSGSIGPGFDSLAVPRFPMATGFADMDRFAVSVRARPLPVRDVAAGPDIRVAGGEDQGEFSFTLPSGEYRREALACYSSAGDRLDVRMAEGDLFSRVFVQLPEWRPGRRKVNCTAPSTMNDGVFYWYSHLWLVKQPDGKWYKE